MPLLRPPRVEPGQGPLVFLAGPIQGAADWQLQASERILQEAPWASVASPRRAGNLEQELTDEQYADQVEWESLHLERAAEEGVILFWLARERRHDCTRAYAQTTRFELAEWLTRHRYQGASVVVAVEEGFPGARYIRYRVRRDFPDVFLGASLFEACAEAVLGLVEQRA